MGGAVAVAEGDVHVEVGVALVVVADDARSAEELDGAGEVQRLAVAVAGFGGQLHRIAVIHAVERTDRAEDHAVVDVRTPAGLGQAEQNVRAGFESERDHAGNAAFCHCDVVICHKYPP